MAHPAAEAVYVPTTNKRDEILFKCKQAIENLHHEVLNQKQMNSELQTQVQQYDLAITQLQDDNVNFQVQIQAKDK